MTVKHNKNLSAGIAVGIATRNAEESLPDCLRTLMSQTVQPNEYVICIGPSNDKTEELIQEFVKQTSVPTKIICDKDGIGTGYARKAIVENCTQEYVAWADSDYILPPNWFEALVEITKRCRFDYLEYPAFDIITPDGVMNMRREGRSPDSINISSLELKHNRPSNILVVRCRAAIEVGNYDPYFIRGQGFDLTIRLNASGYKGVSYEGMNMRHAWRGESFRKSLTRAVYFRFLYKYGLGYAFLGGRHTEHLMAFLLRSSVACSVPLFGLCFITGVPISVPLLMLLGGFGSLVAVLTMRRGFSLGAYVNQLGKCFGEYYLLYKILTDKNKPKGGYGKKFLRRR